MTPMHDTYQDYSKHAAMRWSRRISSCVGRLPMRGTNRLSMLLCRALPTPRPDGPCIVQTKYGFPMIVNPRVDHGLERSLFFLGTYEAGTLNVLDAALDAGGVFLDVGANIGLMSMYAANKLRERGQVVAFEPLPNTYSLLLENIALNQFDNITPVPMAMGSTQGTVDIYDTSEVNRGAASLIKPDHTAPSAKVDIGTLDAYCEAHRIDDVACVKIDVEGWEMEAIRGASSLLARPNAPICIIECSDLHQTYGGTTTDIYNLIRDVNDYRVYRMTRGKERPSLLRRIDRVEELPGHDNIVCMLPAHTEQLRAMISSD